MEYEKKSKEMEYLENNFEQCKRDNNSLYTKNKNAEILNG